MTNYPTPPPTSPPEPQSGNPPAQESYFLSDLDQKVTAPRQESPPPLVAVEPRPESRPGSPPRYRASSPQTIHGRRARPRAGFVKRMSSKLRRLIKRITAYGQKFPIAMGLITMLPIIAGTALFRIGKGLMGWTKGKSMGPNFNLGRSKSFETITGSSDSNGAQSGSFAAFFRMLYRMLNNLREAAPRSFPQALSNLMKHIS